MTRQEELDIVQRVQNGETDVFEILVLEHQQLVYNLSFRVLKNEEDAFDASQEAFLRAFRSLGSYRGDSKFSVWLYRLTSNICIDMLRAKKRRPVSSLTYIDENNEVTELEIPDDRFSPETQAERNELRRAIESGLNELSDDYRQILVLREINGLSYEEIGSVLELEEGTVKSRIFRARKRLCKILGGERNFSDPKASKKPKEV